MVGLVVVVAGLGLHSFWCVVVGCNGDGGDDAVTVAVCVCVHQVSSADSSLVMGSEDGTVFGVLWLGVEVMVVMMQSG